MYVFGHIYAVMGTIDCLDDRKALLVIGETMYWQKEKGYIVL